jgi:uncharacterized protein
VPDFVSLALGNLLAPMTLFFVLGFVAGLAKSDLQIPEQIGKALAIYLMLAIGFKGGAAMASGGGGDGMLQAMLIGVVLSFLMPVLGFLLLRATAGLDRVNAAAVAAHYGSVSVVTFVTAVGFLGLQQVPYQEAMVAVVALMETPAIISGLLLARGIGDAGKSAADGSGGTPPRVGSHLAREVLLNGSVVVLVGAFVIGWVTGDKGMTRVAPFIVEPFTGVLCLFLLEMGLVASRQLAGSRAMRPAVLAFGIYMPLIGAALGLGAAALLDLDLGSATLLAVLAASASYIAVPAAMRMALPRANAAIYLTLALAVTFPFNVLVGIPLYFAAARWLGLT